MTQERTNPVSPIRALHLDRDDRKLTGQAMGYAMDKPSISFTLETKTRGGRTRTEIVGFFSEDFDALYEFIAEAKKHWENDNALSAQQDREQIIKEVGNWIESNLTHDTANIYLIIEGLKQGKLEWHLHDGRPYQVPKDRVKKEG